MRANRLRELWNAGKPVINGWCSMPGAFSAELMASMGWDALTIDTQHGVIGYAEMLAMLQAISTTAATPLVRVSWNQPGEIMRALDAGAYGVICPMINDAAECAAFVQACRYPPEGFRSFGPTRAVVYGGADYFAAANREMLTFAMIETAAGLANVEAIVATPGLDGVYIGPADLSLAIWGGDPLTIRITECSGRATQVARSVVVVLRCEGRRRGTSRIGPRAGTLFDLK